MRKAHLGKAVRRRRNKGAALIMAIALLALFTTLGTLYVRRMNLDLQRVDFEMRTARARIVAEGGVYAALGDLQRALQGKQLVQILDKPISYAFPTYAGIRGPEGLELAVQDNRRAVAEVLITDENGKVNLNHAPASVLQRVLGVDGNTARKITSSLPRDAAPAPPGQGETREEHWLIGVDELLSRGLLTAEQYAAIDPSLVTTFTVIDHASPAGFLNINSAPPPVLAAILDLPVEVAAQVAEKRPFKTLEALSAAAGKAPETFAIKPDPYNPAALPAPLAFESRCFRIVSKAACSSTAGEREYNKAYGQVVAVAVFNADGGYEIIHWDSRRDVEAT